MVLWLIVSGISQTLYNLFELFCSSTTFQYSFIRRITGAFIPKCSYLINKGSLWNLYTEPLRGCIIYSPMIRFHMTPFEVPNMYQVIEPFKVLFRTFYLKSICLGSK